MKAADNVVGHVFFFSFYFKFHKKMELGALPCQSQEKCIQIRGSFLLLLLLLIGFLFGPHYHRKF